MTVCAGRSNAGKVQPGHSHRLRRKVGRVLPDRVSVHDDRYDHELLRGDSQRLSVGGRQQRRATESRLRSDGPLRQHRAPDDFQQTRRTDR